MTDFEPQFAFRLLEKINEFKTPHARRKFLAKLAFCDAHFSRKVGEHNNSLGGSDFYSENTLGYRDWVTKLQNINCHLPSDVPRLYAIVK